MFHQREEVIARTQLEFDRLDALVLQLTDAEWALPVARPESKDPWTVKDALAHVTYWKAGVTRSLRKQKRPTEERGLALNDLNHLVYLRWRDQPVREVLAYHRDSHADLLAALRDAPEAVFSGKKRGPQWPSDATAHVAEHRVKDIERVIAARR